MSPVDKIQNGGALMKGTGRSKGRGRNSAKNRYMKDENPELRKVVGALRSLVKGIVPGTRETVNAWGVPTFENETPFCMYMVGKKHVTFGFHFGTSLEDPEGLLEGTGKNLRQTILGRRFGAEGRARTGAGGFPTERQSTHARNER
jgi:hypothetical protein